MLLTPEFLFISVRKVYFHHFIKFLRFSLSSGDFFALSSSPCRKSYPFLSVSKGKDCCVLIPWDDFFREESRFFWIFLGCVEINYRVLFCRLCLSIWEDSSLEVFSDFTGIISFSKSFIVGWDVGSPSGIFVIISWNSWLWVRLASFLSAGLFAGSSASLLGDPFSFSETFFLLLERGCLPNLRKVSSA